MGNNTILPGFQSFPSAPTYAQIFHDFLSHGEIADWTWSVSGHSAPSAINDEAHGTITLGSGSGTDNAYVSGQKLKETVRLNGLGKTYEFLFRAKLSDATQSDALLGLSVTNTNLINTAITDGIGFRKDDGDTNWDVWMAYDAVTAPDDYSQQLAVGTADTSYHDFGIRVVTDPSTLGKGTVSFFIDGALVAVLTTTSLPHDEELRLSVALQNGEAVAKTMTLDLAGQKCERG